MYTFWILYFNWFLVPSDLVVPDGPPPPTPPEESYADYPQEGDRPIEGPGPDGDGHADGIADHRPLSGGDGEPRFGGLEGDGGDRPRLGGAQESQGANGNGHQRGVAGGQLWRFSEGMFQG